MRRFWDRRAEENPFFFVDDRVDYRNPDRERFWSDGERDLQALTGTLGVSVLPDARVLEIGCGVGRLTRGLAAASASVVALDVSERMLELARELNPQLANVEWVLGDGFSLAPVASESVDACVSHVVFQHIPDPEVTLGYVCEMGRVLRPGGWAAFQVSTDPATHRRKSLAARFKAGALGTLGRAPQGQQDPRWLGSSVALNALHEAVRAGSMQVVKLVGEGTQFCCVLTQRVAI